jgi:exodeoxyribonuclease V beta subunit
MQRNSDKERSDEHQLRLESDAHAVRIVTIHKSKGLEYPVVFCPFVWEGAEGKRRSHEIICHGGEENEILLCDIGLPADPSNRQRAYRRGLRNASGFFMSL